VATIRATIERAREALILGKAEAALEACQEILACYPKHVEASCLLAESRRELRQLPQAAELFERVIAADPESLIGHWGLATILEEQGDLSGALYEMECAWDVSPGQPAVGEDLCRLRAGKGWGVSAVDLTGAGLARLYYRGHQYRRALREAQAASARAGERLDVKLLEAECLWRLGRLDEAAEVAADVLAEAPDCLKANLFRGLARSEAGPRATEEARKLLARALALDPECIVAAELFRDAPLAASLARREVDLSEAIAAMSAASPAQAPSRLLTTAAESKDAAPVPPSAPASTSAIAASRQSRPVEAAPPTAAPVASRPIETVPAPIAEPAATEVVEPESSKPEAEISATEKPTSTAQEEAIPVAEVPESLDAPVPEWLASKPTAVGGEHLPGGLDAQLYAEWADLLGAEVDLDEDAAARLEAALAEATAGAGSAGGWREVILDGDALAATVSPLDSSEPPPLVTALRDESSAPVSGPNPAALLEAIRAQAERGELDAAADGYRELLKTHAEMAREIIEELCRLTDAAPTHSGLRRALGDAYMRSGRFQRAIEEYNRAVSVATPVAAA
jgi:tetratricopeptide (TPR) repeat protein